MQFALCNQGLEAVDRRGKPVGSHQSLAGLSIASISPLNVLECFINAVVQVQPVVRHGAHEDWDRVEAVLDHIFK